VRAVAGAWIRLCAAADPIEGLPRTHEPQGRRMRGATGGIGPGAPAGARRPQMLPILGGT
jgi:hypothetical protein